MKKSIIPLIGIAAFAAAAPSAAFAHGTFSITIGSGYSYGYPGYEYYGYPSGHDREHEELDDQHGDVHDQLDEEHAEAHEHYMTPWEHAQLHRHLRYEHEYTHDQLDREHDRWHRRDWRRQIYGYGGYNGYYGY